MRVTINQYHSFLSKENKKNDFVYNIISVVRTVFPGVYIDLLSNDNSYQQQLPADVSFTQIEISRLMKPIAEKKFISSVRKVVNNQKTDLLISGTATGLDANIPEYILLTDPIQKNVNKHKNIRGFIVPSTYVKRDLIRQGIDAVRIIIVRLLPGELFLPAGWDERESVKHELTGGKEYFILNADDTSENYVINVLKAFSLFKKWQQSNMQLLLINPNDQRKIGSLLQTYKYRNDVKMATADTPELVKCIKAAMAYICLPEKDIAGYPVSMAMQCNVPVISYAVGAVEETGADAVLYTNPGNSEDIAGKMIKLYKDEKLRAQLIQKGKERIVGLKKENMAIQF